MRAKWKKIGKVIGKAGTTITYEAMGSELMIQSRKRHIPHANGIGTWDHTSFFVLKGKEELAEKRTLKDAMAFAEEWKR